MTVRDAAQLRAAIESARGQAGVDPAEVEIIVVDNSPDGAAAWIGRDFASGAPVVRYAHEASPGPAPARNRAVDLARGEFLAFFDDDETAESGWLAALIGVLDETVADAAFGPVIAALKAEPARHARFAEGIFSRRIDAARGEDIGALHARLGTGNSAFRMSTCFADSPGFEAARATIGGEDVLFLRRLVRDGRRLVWAPDARVHEHVGADRVTPGSLRARRFAQGQMRSLLCWRSDPKDIVGLLFWMSAGFAQWLFHAVRRQVAAFCGQDESRELAEIKMAGGLGKILWWRSSPMP